ncbi:hypothetical protein PssvBMR1_gp06 [Pseudomonas phage MR1]|uniref:Uncharacterized protein n=1 Tax=Pseudomonas phage MR1 TaxID=2711169 RepID=A0A6M3TA11_9CAUD|nr:hypothetical protein PssvBMR1_gp06 [Pseudomonas phage MR1]
MSSKSTARIVEKPSRSKRLSTRCQTFTAGS